MVEGLAEHLSKDDTDAPLWEKEHMSGLWRHLANYYPDIGVSLEEHLDDLKLGLFWEAFRLIPSRQFCRITLAQNPDDSGKLGKLLQPFRTMESGKLKVADMMPALDALMMNPQKKGKQMNDEEEDVLFKFIEAASVLDESLWDSFQYGIKRHEVLPKNLAVIMGRVWPGGPSLPNLQDPFWELDYHMFSMRTSRKQLPYQSYGSD